MSRYPWRDTSKDIAEQSSSQWETPGGAQVKADKAEENAEQYSDEKLADHVAIGTHPAENIVESPLKRFASDDRMTFWDNKADGTLATQVTKGMMSPEDKVKLDKSTNGMTPDTLMLRDAGGRAKVAAPSAANDIARKQEVDDVQANLNQHTGNADIHTSAAEHTKLKDIQAGAEVNQNAFSQVNDIQASSKSDGLTVKGGIGITVTTNPISKEMQITATGSATPGAHASSHVTGGTDVIPNAVIDGNSGLMSGADAAFVRRDGETKSGSQVKADAARDTAKSYADQQISKITPASIGAETPLGAQAKADEAQQAAEEYSDGKLAAHLADYVRQPAYAQTTGTATAYTVTLDPAPASIPGGFGITIVPHVDCGANPTLKIGSMAAVALKDQKGNAYASGKLLAGKPYTFRKVGTDFLADSGSGGGGNLQPNQALAGFTFTNDSGEQIGVGDGNLLPENIRSGVEIFRVSGNLVPFLSPGDTVMFSKGSTASGANTTPVKKKEIGISGSSGKIRIKFGIYTNVSSTIAFGQIYINGVAVGIQRSTSSTTAVVFSEDMYVASGDLIQLYIWHSNGTANTYTPTFDLCHNYPVSFS